jgi:hypothetical protein
MSILAVTIPDKNSFYSLFADGPFFRKTYIREEGVTMLFYEPDAVVFLFYSYPTHRVACAVRNSSKNSRPASFPGLSARVSLLFSLRASRVDKLRRALAFLNRHGPADAYSFEDGFYTRLFFLLSARGPLFYPALRKLAAASPRAPPRPALPPETVG